MLRKFLLPDGTLPGHPSGVPWTDSFGDLNSPGWAQPWPSYAPDWANIDDGRVDPATVSGLVHHFRVRGTEANHLRIKKGMPGPPLGNPVNLGSANSHIVPTAEE